MFYGQMERGFIENLIWIKAYQPFLSDNIFRALQNYDEKGIRVTLNLLRLLSHNTPP